MDGTIAGQETGCKDPLSNPAFSRLAEKWLGFNVPFVARSSLRAHRDAVGA